jgi:hypothetical protein
MTKFVSQSLSTNDKTAGITFRWKVMESTNGFDVYAGEVDIRNNYVRYRYAGELGQQTLNDIVQFVNETAAQFKAMTYSEQIEKDLEDSNGRFSRFTIARRVDNATALLDSSSVVPGG